MKQSTKDNEDKRPMPKGIALSKNAPTIKEALVFTYPQLLLMMCHLIISITDLWVAGMLGGEVQAGLGIVAQVSTILALAVSFFASGFSTTISQCLGAKKNLRASRYIVSSLSISFLASFSIGLISIVISTYVLDFIAMEDKELEKIVYTFVIAYSCYLPFNTLITQINSIFRSYKKTKIPVRAIFLVCIVNFIASLGFGTGAFGFYNFGYSGIAWATVLSGMCGFIYVFSKLLKAQILTKKSIASIKWNRKALPYVFGIGIPTAFASLISQSGSVVLMAIMLNFENVSSSLIAGYTLGMRVQSILLFLIMGFSISVSIMSGHLMGARRFDAIYEFGIKMARFVFSMGLICAIIQYFMASYAVEILSKEEAVQKEALYYLNFACILQPFYGINAILMGVFSGVGASRVNASISAFTTWFVNIPIAYVFGIVFDYGVVALYSSLLVSAVLSSSIISYLFYKRKWEKYGLIKSNKKKDN